MLHSLQEPNENFALLTKYVYETIRFILPKTNTLKYTEGGQKLFMYVSWNLTPNAEYYSELFNSNRIRRKMPTKGAEMEPNRAIKEQLPVPLPRQDVSRDSTEHRKHASHVYSMKMLPTRFTIKTPTPCKRTVVAVAKRHWWLRQKNMNWNLSKHFVPSSDYRFHTFNFFHKDTNIWSV